MGFYFLMACAVASIFVSPFLILVLWLRVRRLKKRLDLMESGLSRKGDWAPNAGKMTAPTPKAPEAPKVDFGTKTSSGHVEASRAASLSATANKPPETKNRAVGAGSPRGPLRRSAKTVRLHASTKARLGRLQELFGESLTGIFGAIAVVVGLTFLFAYAAFKYDAAVRFGMLVAVSVLFWVLDFALHRKEAYRPLAHWLGSAGAAVFLLACFGASAIPGLQFIDRFDFAVALLSLGIVSNFMMAYLAGAQSFASLHVVLSLIPLAIVHDSVTYLIGAIVAVGGLAFSVRNVWEKHLFATISGFFLFSLFWWFNQDPQALLFEDKLIYVLGVLSVGLTAALIHYKRDYRNLEGDRWALVVHISNWLMVGVSLSFVSILGQFLFVSLFAAAFAAFLLAREGRRRGILWVYRCDTLLSQALLILALISLGKLDLDWSIRVGLIFLTSYLFAVIHQAEGERLIHKVSLALSQVSILLFCGTFFARSFNPEASAVLEKVMTAPIIFFAGLLLHLWTIKRFAEDSESTSAFFSKMKNLKASLTGVLLPLIPASAFFGFREYEWAVGVFVSLFLLLYMVAFVVRARGLGLGSFFGLALLFGVSWFQMGESHPGLWLDQLKLAAPLLFVGLLTCFFPAYEFKNEKVRWPSMYLTAAHLALSLFFIFQPIMTIVIPLVLVLLTPLMSELVRIFDKSEHRHWTIHLCHIGFAYFILFFTFYFFQTIQSELLVGIVKARFIVELAGMGALIFWYFNLKDRRTLTDRGLGVIFQPLVLEASLLLLVSTVFVEVYRLYHPIFWVGIAFACLRLGFWFDFVSRLRLYSVLFMWASAIHLVAITSAIESPLLQWHLQPWFIGLVSYALIGLYLYLHHSKLELRGIKLEGISQLLLPIKAALEKRPIELLFYPVFFTAALFLFWRLDSAVLTLAWVGLCFMVFVLGTQLRVTNFLSVGFVAVGLCMLRLVFYDLSKTDFFTRGLVFIGVGVLMLGMNFVYRRYKLQLEASK
ncbi:MAG: hypothetical protein EA369_00535 [Bradymonadales bacterium]|nr:MAG: hypothetical protein EA369_00535 [Bradymonadales bacterium]